MKASRVDETLVAVSEALDRARIAHAFSGALASAYFAAPVGPGKLLGVSLLVSSHRGRRPVTDRLSKHGVDVGSPEGLRSRGMHGLLTMLDLRFADSDYETACLKRAREMPFGEAALPIVSCEDLLLEWLRTATPPWPQIEQLLFCRVGELDVDYVRLWMDRLLPDGDARRDRFADVVKSLAG